MDFYDAGARVIRHGKCVVTRAPGSPTNVTYHLSDSYTIPPSTGSPDIYDSSPPFNEDPAHAALLSQGSLTGLTLYNASLYSTSPGSDQDWYYFYGLQGYQYTVSAAPDGTYPYLSMRITNTAGFDQSPTAGSPSFSWVAGSSGNYYIHISRPDASSPTNGTYHLNWSTNAPTATPSPRPGSTPRWPASPTTAGAGSATSSWECSCSSPPR